MLGDSSRDDRWLVHPAGVLHGLGVVDARRHGCRRYRPTSRLGRSSPSCSKERLTMETWTVTDRTFRQSASASSPSRSHDSGVHTWSSGRFASQQIHPFVDFPVHAVAAADGLSNAFPLPVTIAPPRISASYHPDRSTILSLVPSGSLMRPIHIDCPPIGSPPNLAGSDSVTSRNEARRPRHPPRHRAATRHLRQRPLSRQPGPILEPRHRHLRPPRLASQCTVVPLRLPDARVPAFRAPLATSVDVQRPQCP